MPELSRQRRISGNVITSRSNGGVAAIDCLPEVAAASGTMPVLFDSGVRSGTDAIKAIALGGVAGAAHVLKCLLAEADLLMGSTVIRAARRRCDGCEQSLKTGRTMTDLKRCLLSVIRTIGGDQSRRLAADLPAATCDLLSRSAGTFENATALSFFVDAAHHHRMRDWSYRALLGEMTHAANRLTALDIGRTDVVANHSSLGYCPPVSETATPPWPASGSASLHVHPP